MGWIRRVEVSQLREGVLFLRRENAPDEC
jgi:hypothetical protein